MPQLRVTTHLRDQVRSNPLGIEGSTVREVLAQAFTENPGLRGYILDDQGTVRHHVAIFVDGEPITDRQRLSDPVPTDGEVFIMQALSGGQRSAGPREESEHQARSAFAGQPGDEFE